MTRIFIVVGLVAAAILGWNLSRPAPTSTVETTKTKPAATPPPAPQRTPSASVAATPPPPAPPVDPAKVPPSLETKREIQDVFAISNSIDREAALNKLIDSTTDLAGLKGIVDGFLAALKDGRHFGREWTSFWHKLTHRDPRMAGELLGYLDSKSESFVGAIGSVMNEWGNLDPKAAMQWLEANKDVNGKTLDIATLNLIYGYASRDVKAATDYALKVVAQDDPIFGDVAFALSRNAVQQGGTAGLLDWFAALPSDAYRQRLLSSVSNRLYDIDPKQQRAWVAEQASKPWRNDESLKNMIGGWAKADPASAMKFAVSLPPSPTTNSYTGISNAAYEWLLKDADGFTAFYRSLPASPAKSGIIKAVSDALGGKDLGDKKRQAATNFLQAVK